MLPKLDINCTKATLLIEQQLDGPVNLLQKIRLQRHYKACSVCKTYANQVQQLHESLQHPKPDSPTPEHLQALQAKIVAAIEKKVKKKDDAV